MRFEIRYFGAIREAAGRKEETIQTSEDVSLKKLFDLLSKKHGKEYRDLLESSYLRIFVNDRLADGKTLEQTVPDQSTVSLVVALHGGYR